MNMFNSFKVLSVTASIFVLATTVQAGLLDNLGKVADITGQTAEAEKKSSTLGGLGNIASLGSVTDFAKTGSLDTNALLKQLVNQQCKSQLNDRVEWQIASKFMSASQKTKWENDVCGCATEEAVNATSSADLIKVVNPSTRNETIVNITTKAVKGCAARFANF